MMPSGHKAFLVQNPKDVELLLMHNRTFAAEYVSLPTEPLNLVPRSEANVISQDRPRRLFPQACRHHPEGQGARRQGHQPSWPCHHRGLNELIFITGKSFLNHQEFQKITNFIYPWGNGHLKTNTMGISVLNVVSCVDRPLRFLLVWS